MSWIGAGVHLEHWLRSWYVYTNTLVIYTAVQARTPVRLAYIHETPTYTSTHACACACMQLSSNTATTQQGLPATKKTDTPSPGLDPAVTQNQIRLTPCCMYYESARLVHDGAARFLMNTCALYRAARLHLQMLAFGLFVGHMHVRKGLRIAPLRCICAD